MIPILKGDQISQLDRKHLELSGQSSLELMESAANSFCKWFISRFSKEGRISIFCGQGNNGGDGYAIARILKAQGFDLSIIHCHDRKNMSPDSQSNLDRLPDSIAVFDLSDRLPESEVLIDAFLGVGLKGQLRESAAGVIAKMNSFKGIKVAIDMPSGLPSEGLGSEGCFNADYTVSFAQPKLSQLLPENQEYVGELVVRDIGILQVASGYFETEYFYVNESYVRGNHLSFGRFSHKGDFGKVMLVGGSKGKMGAILLSGESAFRTGSGLVFISVDEDQSDIVQNGLKEAMVLSETSPEVSSLDAIGIGPGWGIDHRKQQLEYLFDRADSPLVLDADALNVISKNKELLDKIPETSIITPHLIEFDRIAGKSNNQEERWDKAKDLAISKNIFVVLKGANTQISAPDGRQYFNSTGSQFMATAGSGDVLTGVITSLLGQGYSPLNASILGVFHHGLAGEIASENFGRGTMARDIIQSIPESFSRLGVK